MAVTRPVFLAFALVAFLSLASARETSASTQSALGDVDCDGAVTAIDASILLQRVAGLIQQVPCEKSDDVDENGATNATDAAFVLQFVAGLIPVLPPPSMALANIPTECPQQAQLTDGAIMASDILSRTTSSLFLPSGPRITMAIELDAVLARMRALQPVLADIDPRVQYELGAIIVHAGPSLAAALAAAFGGNPESVSLVTNHNGFDALNVRLRLQGAEFSGPSSVGLCFPTHLNVPASAAAYAALPEVAGAFDNRLAGDGPDIDALKDGDTWYLVVRDASGDCLAGCAHEDFYYFADNGEVIAQVDEADALDNPRFVEVICNFPPRPSRPPTCA